MDARLFNDEFTAKLSKLKTLDALHMLIYPEVFDARLNGDLKYNLAQKKGRLDAKLLNGKFTKNQLLTLLKQYGQIDLYVERFSGDVVADINKEKIKASVDLASNTSSIVTKDTKLNTLTKKVDSTITVTANKQPITATVKGDR